jgi:hypothetical protein
MRSVAGPSEANAPWVIDSNAVLAIPVALQCFQPVTGWCGKVRKNPRLMQLPRLKLSRTLKIGAKAACKPAMKERLRIPIGEAVDRSSL